MTPYSMFCNACGKRTSGLYARGSWMVCWLCKERSNEGQPRSLGASENLSILPDAPHHHEYVGATCVHCGARCTAPGTYKATPTPSGVRALAEMAHNSWLHKHEREKALRLLDEADPVECRDYADELRQRRDSRLAAWRGAQ